MVNVQAMAEMNFGVSIDEAEQAKFKGLAQEQRKTPAELLKYIIELGYNDFQETYVKEGG